jgi:acetolactate decarboxylase
MLPAHSCVIRTKLSLVRPQDDRIGAKNEFGTELGKTTEVGMFYKMKNIFGAILVMCILAIIFGAAKNKETIQQPIIVGAMKDVMWEGKLNAQIDLDSIRIKTHLYGLGPLENLKGEIIVLDGEGYSSTIDTNGKPIVKNGLKVKAPFFCYQNISQWRSEKMPDTIKTMQSIQIYLSQINHPSDRSFLFKIEAEVDSAQLHIVSLPDWVKVSSPDDAHKGQVDIKLKNRNLVLLGFYSNHHQTIFTHHDTYLHIHAISKENDIVGHLDQVSLRAGKATIYLPF